VAPKKASTRTSAKTRRRLQRNAIFPGDDSDFEPEESFVYEEVDDDVHSKKRRVESSDDEER